MIPFEFTKGLVVDEDLPDPWEEELRIYHEALNEHPDPEPFFTDTDYHDLSWDW